MANKPTRLIDKIPADLRMKVAEAITEEWRQRKDRRKDLEKHWKEIDRQLRMEPERSHKTDKNGHAVKGLEWLPETELPLQAQTLEMLMADSRRLKFPRNRDWFAARAALDADYMQRYKQAGSPIPGDKGPAGDIIQDEADRLAAGLVSHFHRQYDFRAAVDMIDASAFTYTFGVGRLRQVRRNVVGYTASKGSKAEKFPVLVPRDVRKVFLDDSVHAVMHEGEIIGPNTIQVRDIKYADLVETAKNDDRYVQDEVRMLTPDKNGFVTLIELEGDLVFDAGSEVIILRDVVVTAGHGMHDGKSTYGLVFIDKGEGQPTYLVSHYQIERAGAAYGSSPLLKGMPIARICAQVMNRLLESGQLKNAPPIGYSRDDPAFSLSGGPTIAPNALWESVDGVNVFDEVGGDPGTLFAIYQGLVQMYTDVTGVTPARLGAITKSHTTAFAKDAELARGESRTVDYTNQCLEGWMTRLLEQEYRMGLKNMGEKTIYIPAWNEFVTVKRDHMPDTVAFMAYGAGAPAEDESRMQRKFNALQAALQMDTLAVQTGKPPTIDIQAAIIKVLEEGGWTDAAEITLESDGGGGQPTPGQLPGVASQPPASLTQ